MNATATTRKTKAKPAAFTLTIRDMVADVLSKAGAGLTEDDNLRRLAIIDERRLKRQDAFRRTFKRETGITVGESHRVMEGFNGTVWVSILQLNVDEQIALAQFTFIHAPDGNLLGIYCAYRPSWATITTAVIPCVIFVDDPLDMKMLAHKFWRNVRTHESLPLDRREAVSAEWFNTWGV